MSSSSIHISDIRAFRQCRRKWNWVSPLRNNLEPNIPYAPFYTGRAVHAALEFYYRDGIALGETVEKYLESEEAAMLINGMWESERQTFEEQMDLIRAIVGHYEMWVSTDTKVYSDRNLTFVALELPFEIPLPGVEGATFGGRFDGIVHHKERGEMWIWETKTTRSIAELTSSLGNDEQSGLYMYAARQLGYPVVGVLYNMLRKKAPAEPAMLASGGLSKAKSIDTSAAYYAHCLQRHFPDWEPETIQEQYGDILGSLKPNENKFFQRFPIYRSAYELNHLVENLAATAKEMMNADLPIYPAPSWVSCNFCSFKPACLTMNAGGNYEVLLAEEFREKVSNTSMRKEDADE